MNILNFKDIVKTDKSARRYLEDICRTTGGNVCPRCGSSEIKRIESGKRKRCTACGYRFSLYSGRWLNEAHISPRSWLWIIKMFEMEVPATRISDETGVSYPPTLKAVTSIRKSIAASTDHGREILHSPGNRHISVFCSRKDRNMDVTSILPGDRIKIVKRLEHGHLICADRGVAFDYQRCGGKKHTLVVFGRGVPRVTINLAHTFGLRCYIRERLYKYRGVSDKMLPLYILEMEYRFKNRDIPLFKPLVENLCRFVPREYQAAADLKAVGRH